MKNLVYAFGAALLASCLFVSLAHASVVIGGTRVVFPAQDGEVTVRLTNDNVAPALIEAWIDRGDPHSTPDKVDVPFLITPPLFRMEPHKDQNLRIIATPATLPADRESLFWLNVLEIPPKPSGAQFAGKNVLQLAIRSRLKFFYRPAKLPGDALKAAAELAWKTVPDAHGYALVAHNPTAYYITITKASLNAGGKSYEAEAGMVAPFTSLKLPLKGLTQAPAADASVAYDTINDYGASVPYKGSITP